MQWLFLGVAIVALLYMSFHYPRTAFGLLAALGITAALIVFVTREDARLSRAGLPVSDIAIENAVMSAAYGDSYQFNARLVNKNAALRLQSLVMSITMLDCPTAARDDSCTVIGQRDERINIQIPPEQARDVSRNLVFSDAIPSGILRWRYKITETRS